MQETIDDELYRELFAKKEDLIETDSASFKEYTFNSEDFVDRSAIWYGSTGSGKTYHLRYCLNQMKNIYPKVILFSPTNEQSGDFRGIINEALCYNELTEYKFVKIIKAQMEIADMYRRINKIEILYEVFLACADNREKDMYKNIERLLQQYINNIEGETEGIKAANIQKIRDDTNKNLCEFMRYVILPRRNNIDINTLSAEAQDCVKYIDLNPRVLIIFDDVQEEIKDLIKKKTESALMFKNLFYKGRHYFITHWYTMQDDSVLAPALRKNAKISILTQSGLANSFITRASNGIDKESQKLGQGLVSKLFQNDQDYRKIIYFKDRSGDEKFQFNVAQNVGLFYTGSTVINEYCDEIK